MRSKVSILRNEIDTVEDRLFGRSHEGFQVNLRSVGRVLRIANSASGLQFDRHLAQAEKRLDVLVVGRTPNACNNLVKFGLADFLSGVVPEITHARCLLCVHILRCE